MGWKQKRLDLNLRFLVRHPPVMCLKKWLAMGLL